VLNRTLSDQRLLCHFTAQMLCYSLACRVVPEGLNHTDHILCSTMKIGQFCGDPSDTISMGARRHGQGGQLPPPRRCCKVFCALAVTVKRLVDRLFLHHFRNFWSAEVVHSVVLARVLRATTKKRSSTFLRKKSAPRQRQSWLRL